MSQSSRRAWNRNSTATNAGPASSSVRGPTSALSSFLRERGINAGRLNPYARLPNTGANAADDGDGDQQQEQQQAEQEHVAQDGGPTQPQQNTTGQTDGEAAASEAVDQSNAATAPSATASAGAGGLGRCCPQDALGDAKKKRKAEEAAQDEPELKKGKAASKPKGKGKGKGKGKDDDSDLSDVAGDTRNNNDKDSLLKFCQRCLRKFIPEVDGEDTCTACLNIPKAGGASRKISALKKRRAVLVDDVLEGSVQTLRDICIKLIADNIDSVEAFGDIPDNVKRSISRILSRRRVINKDTIQLFIGPDEHFVELFDCARLKPDSFNQLVLMSPNVRVLHLADCGQITDEVITNLSHGCPHITSLTLKGAFLVKDAAFETLLSGPIAQNLTDLYLENTAKFGPRALAALTANCKGLKTLCLSNCTGITGEGIVREVGNLVGLTSLELMELGKNVSDDDLISILEKVGKGLTKLSLNGFAEMTDKVLIEGIAKHCPSLQHLSLRNNEHLTDEGMLAYLNTRDMQPHPLKSLDLHRLYNLTDDSVQSIINHHGPSLNRLVLNGLDDLTTHALKSVVSGCPAVTELDMSWVRSFDDDLFGEMVGNCRWLKSVRVYGCNLLTEFSLVKKFFNGEGALIRVIGNEFD
ncbi:RNI-like protein [Rhizoclosmatium globosum]|uniref:RNI-like protein n=1 Tax=Rhizoclosmatium globosum TaxID=329046 RepID=A0A1Y2CNH5_9FUNG|nr:RNI-like protein [Rhizoclosmatium globosum]|eukprot:ORY48552.1 RNI-like protein [Rhizoclosmatium globosum]